jgi:hypothetical protein
MKVREYQLDKLAEARRLQEEMGKLHVVAPVLSWQYEIKDADGNIAERGVGKSNSYTRNALNTIALFAGACSSSIISNSVFNDGYISVKDRNGNIAHPTNIIRSDNVPFVELGTGTSAESLNDYSVTSSGLTAGVNSANSIFNSTTRKLITTIACTFYNNTMATIDVTESGVTLVNDGVSSVVMMLIRDVFTAIPVAAGETITWTYVTEVLYPA